MKPIKSNKRIAPFALRFSSRPASGADPLFQVTVLDAPLSRMGGATTSSFSAADVHSLRAWAERAVGRAQRVRQRSERPGEAAIVATKGQQLYQLLPSEVQAAFRRSCAWAQRHRVTLQLGFEFDDLPAGDVGLADLPWEWLCRPDNVHIGLARETPIVRLVPHYGELSRSGDGAPQRVLLVESAAAMQTLPADVASVRAALEEGFPQATIDVCPAYIEQVRAALRNQTYQMVCFLGHGDFEEISGQGRLFFSDGDGALLPLNGAQLAALLSGVTSLRLVLLLACQSGRRMAGQLVRQGVPAVVAMQFPVSDLAAAVFVRALGNALSVGDPIAVATVEGRRALKAAGFALEWGTPACYLPRPATFKLSWTDRVEEFTYAILDGFGDLLTPPGQARLFKAALLVVLQRLLWLPWVGLTVASITRPALALLTGCLALPPLVTLLSRSPAGDELFAQRDPRVWGLLRRYQFCGAFLGYLIGQTANYFLLALPLYYLGLGEILPSILWPLVWWAASIIPLLLTYTGLRRVSRNMATAYRTLRWDRTDTLILLGVPLVVAPSLTWLFISQPQLWLDRELMPWLLGLSLAAVTGWSVWQERKRAG